MIRVYQKTPTSCMAACVASIIECEFEDVPESFYAESWDHFDQRFWLSTRVWGMAEHKILEQSMWPPTEGMLCIVSGKSPRGDHKHAVVARTQYDTSEPFEVVHDPYGSTINLPYAIDGEIEIVTWLIPLEKFQWRK